MAKAKKFSRTLDGTTGKRTIVSVRQAILKRLKELGKTRHWLAKETGMRTATLYNFLTKPGATTRSDKVESMLTVLGLEIRSKT